MFKNIFNWVKAGFFWALNSENRKHGIRYASNALGVLSTISKITKTKTDDEAVKFISENFTKICSAFNIDSIEQVTTVAETVSKSKKSGIKNLGIKYDTESGAAIKLGVFNAEYNPKNGKSSFFVSSDF